MGSRGLRVPGPVLFLLMLLPPPPLQSTESFLHSLPGWRNFHQDDSSKEDNPEIVKVCDGNFDVYLVMDASDNVKNNWKYVHKFVDDMVKKFNSPKLRMSFITYSTQGHTLMKLTSDRNEIRDGLSRLQNVVPTGAANMQEGFKKANEQIQQANSGGHKTRSLIISLTAGPMQPTAAYESNVEANNARSMGAKVYCVGVNDYRKDQLITLIQKRSQLFEAGKKFSSLEDIVDMLVMNSCVEVLAGKTYFVCVGESYEARFYIPYIDQAKAEEIICRYKLANSPDIFKKPLAVTQDSLICPGYIFEYVGQNVTIDSSLNRGDHFLPDRMTITGVKCKSTTTIAQKTPVPTTVTRKTTPVPTTTTRKTTRLPTTTTRKTTRLPTTTTRKTTRLPTTTTRKTTPAPTTTTRKTTRLPTTTTRKTTQLPTTTTRKTTRLPTTTTRKTTRLPTTTTRKTTRLPMTTTRKTTLAPTTTTRKTTRLPTTTTRKTTPEPTSATRKTTRLPTTTTRKMTPAPTTTTRKTTRLPTTTTRKTTPVPTTTTRKTTRLPTTTTRKTTQLPTTTTRKTTRLPTTTTRKTTRLPTTTTRKTTPVPTTTTRKTTPVPTTTTRKTTPVPTTTTRKTTPVPTTTTRKTTRLPTTTTRKTTPVPTTTTRKTTPVPTTTTRKTTPVPTTTTRKTTRLPTTTTRKTTPVPTTTTRKTTPVPTTTTRKTTPVPTTTTRKTTPAPTTTTRKTTPAPTTTTRKTTPAPTTVPRKMTPAPTTVAWKMTPLPTTVTRKTTPVPTVVPQSLTPGSPLFFPVLIPALLIFPVLIWCIWCWRRTVKEPPPVQKPEKEPESCPTVIVPCCGCQQDRIRRMEGKLDTLCDFVQSCNQVPLMWCQPRDKGRCINFTLVKPPSTPMPCSPKICLQSSQECFLLNSCSRCQHPPPICSRPPSRMLPLITPPAQALCRTALSLPPP